MVNDFVLDNIRLFNTKPLCLGMHIQNLVEKLELKQQEIPEKFTHENLDRYIHSLLNVNKVYKNGMCQIVVFWQKYPDITPPEFCIFTEPMETNISDFGTNGFILEFFKSYTENTNYFPTESTLQTSEVIPCNIDKYGNIYSAGSNDLLVLRDNQIIVCEKLQPFTTYLIEYLARKNWPIVKIPSFTVQDISESSEILFCNPFNGIQWIRRIRNHNSEKYSSYGVKYAKTISQELNLAMREM